NMARISRNRRCDRLPRFYLLEMLVPLLFPDDLTVENHRGSAQTERCHLCQPGLHKWLQMKTYLFSLVFNTA
ncbi:hypothetical protein XENORESO_010565, partial [Xenotaenia resolanae]